MPLISIAPGWETQPGLTVNPGLRLGFVLDPQANGAKGKDLVTLANLTAGGASGTQTPSARGMSLDYLTVGTKYADYAAIPSFLPGTADFAVLVSGVFQPGTVTGIALSNYVLGTSGAQWRLQPNWNGSSTVSGSFSFLTYDGTAFTNAGANSLISAGEYATFLGVRRGTTVELWKNGSLVATATGTIRGINANTSIGFGWGAAYTYTAGGIRTLGFGILGTVPQGLAISLSENPRQILLSPPIDIWVPSAGASNTVTAAASTGTSSAGIGALTQSQALSGATSAEAAGSGTAAIIQVQVLAGAASAGTAASGIGALVSGLAFSGAACSEAASSGAGPITQVQPMLGATSVQPVISSAAAISLGAAITLTASGGTQAAIGGAAAIAQAHVIVCAPAAVDSISSSSRIVRDQILAASPNVQIALSSASSLVAPGSVEPPSLLPIHVQRATKRRFGRIEYASGFRRLGFPRPLE